MGRYADPKSRLPASARSRPLARPSRENRPRNLAQHRRSLLHHGRCNRATRRSRTFRINDNAALQLSTTRTNSRPRTLLGTSPSEQVTLNPPPECGRRRRRPRFSILRHAPNLQQITFASRNAGSFRQRSLILPVTLPHRRRNSTSSMSGHAGNTRVPATPISATTSSRPRT